MKTRLLSLWIALTASALVRAEPTPSPGGYVAHEWGTFTSVQGSDGDPLPWNPFTATDLPAFVFSRQTPTFHSDVFGPNAGRFRLLHQKFTQAWLQRMETPVIYFHAPEEISVDVRVKFPKGLLTEWFPQVTSFGPVFGVEDVLPNSEESHLRWDNVRVLSANASVDAMLAASLPTDGLPSHYYPARQTTANLLEITHPFAAEPSPQRDRVLFYRGAGNFAAPLRVSVEPQGHLRIANQGTEPVGPLFGVRADPRQLSFVNLGHLAPGASRSVQIPHASPGTDREIVLNALGADLRRALGEAGLYEDEAAAMVNTWRESWFTESGVRLLYLLPGAWTDAALPLELNPPPRELVRVMVGRADVLEPATERSVMDLLSRHARGEVDAALDGLRRQDLGRFLEPAISRAGTLLFRESRQNRGRLGQLLAGRNPAAGLDPQAAWQQELEQLKARLRTPADSSPLNTAAR